MSITKKQFAMKTYVTILIMTFTVLAHQTFSQELFVKFKILNEEGKNMKGASIKLYKMNTLVMADEKARANNKMILDKDSYYTIEVSKPGYITKRIGVYTTFDEVNLIENVYEFFVQLEEESKYAQYSNYDDVMDYPIAIVQYDDDEQAFDYNYQYWQNAKKQLAILKAQAAQSLASCD
ncbi:MAG: hypothetical protein Kow0075_16440 [Salibacteraceae bacterium]